MHPTLRLNAPALAANARAWQRRAGVPLRAVVKSEGYGWGYAAVCTPLESIADAFCVSDADELRALRRCSRKPAIVLGAVSHGRLLEVLASDGLPTVSTTEEIEFAAGWAASTCRSLQLRVGLLPAAGWSGLSRESLDALAPSLVSSGAEVELWTHVTSLETLSDHVREFEELAARARAAGVRVAGTEVSSTAPLARSGALGGSVRVGIGLFGSGKSALPEVSCALQIEAPVLRVERHSAGTRVGYGAVTFLREEEIAVVRCGYGDGLPQSLGGAGDFLSVGMQYATVRSGRCNPERTSVVILDESSDLDDFATQAGRTAHEVVTAFGNASRAFTDME